MLIAALRAGALVCFIDLQSAITLPRVKGRDGVEGWLRLLI